MARVFAKTFILAVAFTATVTAHGEMSKPKPQWNSAQADHTAPCGIIDGPTVLPGGEYGRGPTENTEAFTKAFKASQYKTLKDLVMDKTKLSDNAEKECGFTKLGDKQPLPNEVEWSHGAGEGFTRSHEGPCEVWCDNERVFQDDNCAKNFPEAPAKLKIDKSKCQGKSTLKTIWLALHSPQWQVYINCAALEGGNGGDYDNDSNKPAPPSYPQPGPAPAPAPQPQPEPQPEPCPEDEEPEADDNCSGPVHVQGRPIDWNDHRFLSAFETFVTEYHNSDSKPYNVRRE